MTDPSLFDSSGGDAAVGVIDAAWGAAPALRAAGTAGATAAEGARMDPAPAPAAANGGGDGSAAGGFGGGGFAAGGGGSSVGANGDAGASGADAAGGLSVGASGGAGVSGPGSGGGLSAAACGCGGVSAVGAGEDPGGWLSAVLGVLREGLGSLGVDRLDERLGLVGRAESALAAVKSETVAAIAARRGEEGAAEAVRDRLRETRGKAKRDVRVAGRLEWLPDTAEALAGGVITAQQATMIAEAAEEAPIDEGLLLAAAEEQPVDRFGRTVRDHLNERAAGEDVAARRCRQRARRAFSVRRQTDGMYRLSGWLDPLAGAKVQTALGGEYRRLLRAQDPKNRATTAQLYADALEALVTRRGKAKPLRATLVIVADYDYAAGQLADPRLADGTPLAADEFVKLALEADILPALYDTDGQPLWLGRAVRDASAAQRIALAVRDKGCVGCGAANSFCEPHHVKHWEDGGPTDIDNLCLLCGHCHHKEAHSKHGANIVQEPHGKFTMRRTRQQPNDVNRPLRR